MGNEVVTQEQINSHEHWIAKIGKLSNKFGVNTKKVEDEFTQEIKDKGLDALLGHLRLCGAIPECYGHNTSEEKLYSKYTDVVIHEAYRWMGFNSVVVTERADAADVECCNDDFSFVADAKAFRLSRTAKNQKDFKVQSMDGWKHGKDYAMIVCPVYQLPSRTSQIYQQAGERSVCISTYTHLAVFARYACKSSKKNTMKLVHEGMALPDVWRIDSAQQRPTRHCRVFNFSVKFWLFGGITMEREFPCCYTSAERDPPL